MTANVVFERAAQGGALRGFGNLYRKEHRAWWGTRRWWINALLWTVLLGGLTALMLFAAADEVSDASPAEIAQAGGEVGYMLMLGLDMFFQFGVPVLAIGTIVLLQDTVVGDRQSGMAAWLLSKPVTRRAYVLAKATANGLGVLVLLIALPSVVVYGLLSLRLAALYPALHFLAGVGLLTIHTLFYLTLTLMLGTLFNGRGPILGITLASVLGGGMLGSLIEPLSYVMPWMLPNLARAAAAGEALPAGLGTAAVVATILWSYLFIFVALYQFDKVEY